MKIELSRSEEFRLDLDPVECEDDHPSVAFDIEASLNLFRDSMTISLRHCWFSHESLNRFEEELRGMAFEQTVGPATLRNMSDVSIITVDREGDRIRIRIQGIDYYEIYGRVVLVEFERHFAEIREMFQGLEAFPKWW